MTGKDINGRFGWIEMTQLAIRLALVIRVTGKIVMDSLPILFVKPQLVFKLKLNLALMDRLKLLTLTTSKVNFCSYSDVLSNVSDLK